MYKRPAESWIMVFIIRQFHAISDLFCNSLLQKITGSSLLITEKFVWKIMKPATHRTHSKTHFIQKYPEKENSLNEKVE